MPDINELVEARQRFLEGEELHEDRSLVIRILGDLIQAKELIQGISGVLLPGDEPEPEPEPEPWATMVTDVGEYHPRGMFMVPATEANARVAAQTKDAYNRWLQANNIVDIMKANVRLLGIELSEHFSSEAPKAISDDDIELLSQASTKLHGLLDQVKGGRR